MPQGWHNWKNPSNEQTARYLEYNNTGDGANTADRAPWSKQLTKKEAAKVTVENVFKQETNWIPKM